VGLASAFGEIMDLASVMFHKVRSAVNRAVEPIIRDGTVPAFFRQGADEIGMALKAFPDSLQAHEPGTILNPTQGEIAASRSPRGSVYGRPNRQANPDLPSPSEIAKDKRPYVPEQDHGRDRQHGR
jgi:hypothetical protein